MEADHVLDFIDRAVGDAQAVGTGGEWGRAPVAAEGSVLEMLVDIDGDAHTGSYSAGGISGLERVLVYRRFPGDERLLALVFAKQPDEAEAEGEAEPRRSIITDELDARDPGAFEVEFVRGSGGAPRSVKVSLALSDGSESRSASRTVRYTGLPPG